MSKIYNALEALARRNIPENTDLWPRIAAITLSPSPKGLGAQAERRSFMQNLRARPALIILLALISLALLTGVVYAVGRSLGYIPGIGLVEQGSLIRVLAEPVTVTRDGITLTVTDAILTADKTIVIYTLENIPWIAYSHDENVGGCPGMADLRLPDGKILKIVGGGGTLGKNRFDYPAIPMNINEATYILPCISGTLPGLAPENWELPLHFKPAPPDMTVVPVLEIAPTSTAVASTLATTESPLSITKILEIGDNYIVQAEFDANKTKDNANPEAWWQSIGEISLTDGNGNSLYATSTSAIEMPTPSKPNAEVFAYQISKNFTPPLIISYPGIYIANVGDPRRFEFEFDAGANPQPGQVWTLNRDFTVDGYSLRLVSISAEQDGYTFNFDHATPVNLFAENSHVLGGESVEIAGHISIGGGGGGGNQSLIYATLPTGKLNIIVSVQHLQSFHLKNWQIQWAPAAPSTSLYGITLKLDKFIPLVDGYYLIGHTEWTDARIVRAVALLRAYDTSGRELILETADWQEFKPADNQWIYKISGQAFDAPVTLRATQMSVSFKDPLSLTLDLRNTGFEFSDKFLNLPYKTGLIPLEVPGILANAFKATYVGQGDLRGFEIAIQTDPALQGIGFSIASGLDTTGMSMVGGGGGSNRDETTGLVLSTVLTDAKMNFPLVLHADGAVVNGNWETIWTPSAPPAGATPVYIPQACLTFDKWKQAARNSVPLPTLDGHLLVSGRILNDGLPPSPDSYGILLTNLAGTNKQVIGKGNNPSVSTDGAILAYDWTDGIHVLATAMGKDILLPGLNPDDFGPRLSPDGRQLVFVRPADMNLYLANADGSNLRQFTDTPGVEEYAQGWTADGSRIIYLKNASGQQSLVAKDTATGQEATLFVFPGGVGGLALAPDGKTLAYSAPVPGRMAGGIYLTSLDTSSTVSAGLTTSKLLAQLDYWLVDNPRWSPDGQWLSVVIVNNDSYTSQSTPALINVETCQSIPISGFEGAVEGWVKP
jgi:hypothetical protein